jgi:hypothetical protein
LDPDALFIFNLHREFFFYSAHKYKNQAGAHLLKRKYLTWKGDPLLMVANSPSQVPCLKSTALAPLAFPSPSTPLPLNRAFILHTSDINKPNTSVRHRNNKLYLKLRFKRNYATISLLIF